MNNKNYNSNSIPKDLNHCKTNNRMALSTSNLTKTKIQQNLLIGWRMTRKSNKVVMLVFHLETKRDTEELLKKYLGSICVGVVNHMDRKEAWINIKSLRNILEILMKKDRLTPSLNRKPRMPLPMLPMNNNSQVHLSKICLSVLLLPTRFNRMLINSLGKTRNNEQIKKKNVYVN